MTSITGLSGREQASLAAVLAAHLCFGAAHVSTLPPWEGFDETGHFSSIQQLWDQGETPRVPGARMSLLVQQYALAAPLPYATLPPFDHNGGWTYREFFLAGDEVIDRGRKAAHGGEVGLRRFEPGDWPNHVAQHPPLFYALMGPLYGLTRDRSLASQLLVCRLVAYAMCWLALVIGIAVAARYLPTGGRPFIPLCAAALWPLFVPSWFPAMARLGNDALTALLIALLWLWLAVRGCRSTASALVIGLILGAGALTKAFFIPVAAGTFAWCLAQSGGTSARDRLAAMGRLALTAAVMVVLAGWWYGGPSALAIAGSEAAQLDQLGGLVPALRQHFSLSGWLAGWTAFLGMLAWSSTWSLARPPHVLFVPIMAGLLAGGICYLAALRDRARASIGWLPVWLAAPVLAGFAYHILVHTALTGSGRGVGGYYLHVLVAPLTGATALAVRTAWRYRLGKIAVCGHLVWAGAFALSAAWAQMLLFAGLLTKNADRYYELTGPLPAWLGVPEALRRASVLAFPRVGIVLALAGVLLISAAAVLALGEPRPRPGGCPSAAGAGA